MHRLRTVFRNQIRAVSQCLFHCLWFSVVDPEFCLFLQALAIGQARNFISAQVVMIDLFSVSKDLQMQNKSPE